MKFNQNLINKKEAKFRKDSQAFSNNRAYRWPTPNQPNWRTKRNKYDSRDSDTSEMSDYSSTKSFTSTNTTGQRNEYPSRGRRFGRGGRTTPTNHQSDNPNTHDNPRPQPGAKSRTNNPGEGMSTRNIIRNRDSPATQNQADFVEPTNRQNPTVVRQTEMDQYTTRIP